MSKKIVWWLDNKKLRRLSFFVHYIWIIIGLFSIFYFHEKWSASKISYCLMGITVLYILSLVFLEWYEPKATSFDCLFDRLKSKKK